MPLNGNPKHASVILHQKVFDSTLSFLLYPSLNRPLHTTLAQLPAIARCHRAAFPASLASALGNRYVARMLSWYLASDKTFLFHIEDEQGRVAGYCGGMISDGTLGTGSASGMAQHTFRAAVLWAMASFSEQHSAAPGCYSSMVST